MSMTVIQAVELLVLLAVANGAPVVATRLLGDRFGWPVDGGLVLRDGRPLLGPSKTVRGFVVAVLAAGLTAWAFGLGWWLGLGFGAAAMAGDAFSSFTKRRLGIVASGQARGLDQVPEALFPLLVCYRPLGLGPVGVVLVVAVFTVAQLAVSPLMYRLGIRERPY